MTAINRVKFGDLIAALTLEVAKDIITEKCTTIDALVASQLADFTYVEDRASGGNEEEVDGMAGSQSNPAFVLNQILCLNQNYTNCETHKLG